MCQESLINYLATAMGDNVPRTDLATFIRVGELAVQNDMAKEAGTVSYSYQMPASIRTHAHQIDKALAAIKICDPAIGSGAFPVGMMQEIVKARDVLTTYIGAAPNRSTYNFKRHAIQESIYGVDIDPGAIEIAKLRLWLSLVVDERNYHDIKPLPNLDYKIVCGNSLLSYPYERNGLEKLEALKTQFRDETNLQHKNELRKKIEKELDEIFANTTASLGYQVTVDFQINFSEIFKGRDVKRKGFDIVIANPPYINTNEMKALSKIYRKLYDAAYGSYDVYTLFIELASKITKVGGSICVITSNKYMIADYGIKLRELLLKKVTTQKVIDLADCKRVFEGALVSPAITIIKNLPSKDTQKIKVAILKDDDIQSLPNISFSKRNSIQFASNTNQVFDIYITDQFRQLISKMFDGSAPLGQIADVRTGVMGFDYWSLDEYIKDGYFENSIKIATNGFIDRYRFKWGSKTRLYKKDIYHPHLDIINAPLNQNTKDLFLSEKIIIRGVAQKLSANLDTTGMGLLVAVHSAIVTDPMLDPKYVLALINSDLLNWYHIVNFYTARIPEGSLKYPVSFLKDIPVRKLSPSKQQPFIELVDQILCKTQEDYAADTSAIEANLNMLVYKAYGLHENEIAMIEHNSDTNR
jgi:hypothetical protein